MCSSKISLLLCKAVWVFIGNPWIRKNMVRWDPDAESWWQICHRFGDRISSIFCKDFTGHFSLGIYIQGESITTYCWLVSILFNASAALPESYNCLIREITWAPLYKAENLPAEWKPMEGICSSTNQVRHSNQIWGVT